MNNLKLLHFPGTIPTLYDTQLTFFRVDVYSALIALFIVGLRYVNKFHDGGFIDIANDENESGKETDKLYTHPDCIQQLQYLLDIFDRRGYFDF